MEITHSLTSITYIQVFNFLKCFTHFFSLLTSIPIVCLFVCLNGLMIQFCCLTYHQYTDIIRKQSNSHYQSSHCFHCCQFDHIIFVDPQQWWRHSGSLFRPSDHHSVWSLVFVSACIMEMSYWIALELHNNILHHICCIIFMIFPNFYENYILNPQFTHFLEVFDLE